MISLAIGPIQLSRDISIAEFPAPNPGIGGTEFQTIWLAHELAKAGYKVSLFCDGGKVSSKYLKSEHADLDTQRHFDIQILPLSQANHAANTFISPQKKIVMSHHPHDLSKNHMRFVRECDVLISVGKYQYWSNSKSPIAHFWLPGLCRAPVNQTRPSSLYGFTVGHISSLHPSKGFHVLAKAWAGITAKIPNARLEVIGGLHLYGEEFIDAEIPTSPRYADKIRKAFGGVVPSNVIFHGVLSGEALDHVAQSWHLAVLNPIGTGEADPGVVRDVWRLGVPVVSTMRFGMGDYMEHFPELWASSPRVVTQKVVRMLQIPEELASLSEKALEQADELWARALETIGLWKSLIASVAAGFGPINPPPDLKPKRLSPLRRCLLAFGSVTTYVIHQAGRFRDFLNAFLHPLH